MYGFLEQNPIVEKDDIDYILKTVEEQKLVLEASLKAKAQQAEILDCNWTGQLPYLRMIHCIIDNDDIKYAFMNQNNIDETRMNLENRNLVVRLPTVYDLVSMM